jgi:hypothetical protein
VLLSFSSYCVNTTETQTERRRRRRRVNRSKRKGFIIKRTSIRRTKKKKERKKEKENKWANEWERKTKDNKTSTRTQEKKEERRKKNEKKKRLCSVYPSLSFNCNRSFVHSALVPSTNNKQVGLMLSSPYDSKLLSNTSSMTIEWNTRKVRQFSALAHSNRIRTSTDWKIYSNLSTT